MKKVNKVFLGGTRTSDWRNGFIDKLNINYFNPVVDDWNDEAYQKELYEREHCDFVLYVITPKMAGAYSIAEVIDDSNKRPEKTIFCFVENESNEYSSHSFPKKMLNSMFAVGKMVEKNGAHWFKTLEECVEFLNGGI